MSNSSSNSTTNNKQETLMNAGKKLDEVITRDQEYSDLSNLLSGSTLESYIQPLLEPQEELQKTNEIKLPKIFVDKLADMQCRCFMGLLPEIGRAWLTIDHRLYIWNLSDETDIIEYNDQDQIIITVGLVKPRANIFGDQIKYMLVISTPLQIILLAVSMSQQVYHQSIQLYATNIAIPADDIQMQHITGTEDGRIFMIGNNGGLYEVEYSHPNKWFKNGRMICRTEPFLAKYIPTFTPKIFMPASPPPIKSVAIDNERKVLYILYTNSAIEVVYLGDTANPYKRICTNTTIIDDAVRKCRQQSKFCSTQELEISSIHVISSAESKRIHLLAVTVAGYRLYFSHYNDAFRFLDESKPLLPSTLELGYIRSAPPDLNRPHRFFTNTYYDRGICLSIHPQSDTVDQLEMTSVTSAKPATGSQPTNTTMSFTMNTNRSNYVETNLSFDINEKICLITEMYRDKVAKYNIKEVSQQLSDTPRQFMLLSNLSIFVYQKLRPVDILFNIISYSRGVQKDASLIQAFFDRYGQIEACAMCLSIICSTDEEHIITRATKLFFEFGGVPSAAYANQVTGNHLGRVIGPTAVQYSGKHDGFVLYFSRIVAPVWRLKAFHQHENVIDAQLHYTQSQRLLYDTKMKLLRLKQFMDINPHFHDSANISNPRFQTTDRNIVQLELTEQKSVHDLYQLLVQCIEAIAFIEFILDSNVQTIMSNYVTKSAEAQKLDLNSILTSPNGKELTGDIVIATISKYAATTSHAGFDIVTRQLEKFCHSFFTESDLHFFKGVECIRRALLDESEYERTHSLKESLKHFKIAVKDASHEKINQVCNTYKECSFHIGIIELVLERAERLDPHHQAIIAFEASSQDYCDDNCRNLLLCREEAYKNIFSALDDVFEIKKVGHVPVGRIPVSDVRAYYKMVFDTAIRSKDKLFHFKLYDWLMTKDAMDEVISVNTEYLIPYLEKCVTNKKASLEFLWKYYRLKGMFVDTARCLERLASFTADDLQLNIEERVSYLAQAVINGRCATSKNPNVSPYIEDLEERLRWAQRQARAKSILKSMEGLDAQAAASLLDKRLFSDTELTALTDQFPHLKQILE